MGFHFDDLCVIIFSRNNANEGVKRNIDKCTLRSYGFFYCVKYTDTHIGKMNRVNKKLFKYSAKTEEMRNEQTKNNPHTQTVQKNLIYACLDGMCSAASSLCKSFAKHHGLS